MSISIVKEPAGFNIQCVEGDSLDNWTITNVDEDGNAIDITSYDFYWIVKNSKDTPDEDAVIAKEPVDAVKSDSGSGTVDTFAFPLTADETEIAVGCYVQSIKVIVGTDESTWFAGNFEITPRHMDTP